MTDLLSKKCVPCEVGMPPLSKDEAEKLLKEIPDWEIVDDSKKIQKEFKLESFRKAIEFVDKIADIAEQEGHHPDIHIFYKKVIIELTTHNIHGLSENDFIVAAKINTLL